jgi:hypothetical protein
MACLAWLVLFLVGWGYRVIDLTRVATKPALAREMGLEEEEVPREKPLPDWVYTTADTVHFILPHMKDLDVLTTRLIIHDLLPADSPDRKQADTMFASFKWGEALTISSLYIVLLVGLSCWRFATRDY